MWHTIHENAQNKSLGEIEDIDLDGHEKRDNHDHMIASLKKYYGDKANQNTEVKIIKFKLL